MPMVYVPNAGDVIVFNQKKGILVRSVMFDCLSFFTIDDDGNVSPDENSQNKNPKHFKTANMMAPEIIVSDKFAIALNAIKQIPSAVSPLI